MIEKFKNPNRQSQNSTVPITTCHNTGRHSFFGMMGPNMMLLFLTHPIFIGHQNFKIFEPLVGLCPQGRDNKVLATKSWSQKCSMKTSHTASDMRIIFSSSHWMAKEKSYLQQGTACFRKIKDFFALWYCWPRNSLSKHIPPTLGLSN